MIDTLLAETAERLFTDHVTPKILAAAENGAWPEAAWNAVTEAGLHLGLVPEAAGGFGAPIPEALDLLRIAGKHALPLPLAETMLAAWLLAGAGLAIPEGPLTVVAAPTLALRQDGTNWHMSGNAVAIPWARSATAIVVLSDGYVALAPEFRVAEGQNIAREPRDSLAFDCTPVAVAATGVTARQLRAIGAAMRTLQIAGALERVTAMTVQYAQDRTQFGRPIGRFQAVQHNLAILASQTAAALAAGSMAAEAVAEGICLPTIAAAKARAGEAAGLGAAIAHQIHGALGFTYEHRLQYFTKRLWAWRDEFGGETEWNLLLGNHLVQAGPEGLWPALTFI